MDKLMNSEEVIRKREIEKKKVEVLKQELFEVQREEYELGLKLYWVYKRLDRDNEFELMGLWVRRVMNQDGIFEGEGIVVWVFVGMGQDFQCRSFVMGVMDICYLFDGEMDCQQYVWC